MSAARQQILKQEQTASTKERLGKHVSAAMDTYDTENGVSYVVSAEMLSARYKVRGQSVERR
jgi:uncharacterized protein YpmS